MDSHGLPVSGANVKVFCVGQYEYSEQLQEITPRFTFTTDTQGYATLQSFSRPEGWFDAQDILYVMATNYKILDNHCTATLVKVNKDGYVGTVIPVWSFMLRAERVMNGTKIYTISTILNKN